MLFRSPALLAGAARVAQGLSYPDVDTVAPAETVATEVTRDPVDQVVMAETIDTVVAEVIPEPVSEEVAED